MVMDGDFNKKGNKYETLAVKGQRSDYGTLNDFAAVFLETLHRLVCSKWQGSEENKQKTYNRFSACLERLQAFLFQCSKLQSHAKNLEQFIPQEPGEMFSLSGIEACVDFESLLYLGRSALDRLTFMIAKQTYNQDCEKFNKLSKVVENFSKNDVKASNAVEIIVTAEPYFHGLLINATDRKTNLRSLLAHSRSTGESLTDAFTVHRGPEDNILRFDLELGGYPLLQSAHLLNKYVPFVILNIVGIYLDYENRISPEECEPTWFPRCITFSKFISDTGKGPMFTTIAPNPCGFMVKTRTLRADVFEHIDKIKT